MKKTVLIVFCILISASIIYLDAQCPMCRVAAESNLKNGGTEGKGLNTGILYMLSLPYLLICTIGFLWYKRNRKEQDGRSV